MNEDTISRQAVLDLLIRCAVPENGGSLLYQSIKQLPSAEPKRIKGRWIEMSLYNHTYKCSECGRLLFNVTDGKNNVLKHYPYCHCGAKMEEVWTN